MAQASLARVVLWMTGTLLSFLVLAVSVRSLSGALSVFEILALRNIGGVVVVLPYAAVTGERVGWPLPLRIHVLRNVIHFAGQSCWAYGITVLPLATVFALEFTTPAWTMLLAVLFLGERLSAGRVGAVVLGFVGVLVILRPGLGTFQPAALVVLLAAMMFAVQMTTTKFLTATNSVLTIMVWMNVMQLPMYLGAQWGVFGGGVPWVVTHIHLAMLPAVVALCVSGLSAHVCLTNAFRYGEAITVVPIDFLRVPAIALVGVVVYGEAFDPLVLLGAAISGAGILWSLRETARRALR